MDKFQNLYGTAPEQKCRLDSLSSKQQKYYLAAGP